MNAILDDHSVEDLIRRIRSTCSNEVYVSCSGKLFEIACPDIPDYRGIWLIQTGRGGAAAPHRDRDIEFRLMTPRSSGLFARAADEVWLMHNGRVHRDRPKLARAPDTPVRFPDGTTRLFHKVAKIGNEDFVGAIAEFGDLSKRSAAAHVDQIPVAKEHRDDPGPTGGGTRSQATWEAQQSPLALAIAAVLDKLECQPTDVMRWRPDIIRITPSSRIIIVEVKPDAGHHNVITAIGQCICYRSSTSRPISVVAAPGISGLDKALFEVFDLYQIHAVDTDCDLLKQFSSLL